jgi:predicted neutral ceramidase superfamily lipid hydrolase
MRPLKQMISVMVQCPYNLIPASIIICQDVHVSKTIWCPSYFPPVPLLCGPAPVRLYTVVCALFFILSCLQSMLAIVVIIIRCARVAVYLVTEGEKISGLDTTNKHQHPPPSTKNRSAVPWASARTKDEDS